MRLRRSQVGSSPNRLRQALADVELGPDERWRLAGSAYEIDRSFSQLRLALRIPARPVGEGPDRERPASNPLTHIRSTAALDGIGVGSLRIGVG